MIGKSNKLIKCVYCDYSLENISNFAFLLKL